MTEGTYPRWRMFESTVRDGRVEIPMRIHYMVDDSMSFGFVEQRMVAGMWEFIVTMNSNFDVQNVFVTDLQAGMTMIEWLYNERKETT